MTVNTLFSFNKFAWLQDTCVNTLYKTCSCQAFLSSETIKGKLSMTVEVTASKLFFYEKLEDMPGSVSSFTLNRNSL